MTPDATADVEAALERGDPEAARDALLRLLDGRAAEGDAFAALTARVLRRAPVGPDRLAAETARLLAIAEAQDRQIEALLALLDRSP